MKTIKKSLLKEGYYYEFKPFYNSLPATLTIPEYQTEIFPKDMSHQEILDTYKIEPYQSIQDAFAVAADCIATLKNDWKGRIIYFMDGDTRYRLDVFRDSDGRLGVGIDGVNLDGWDAGYGVLFSNKDPKPLSSATLDDLGSLSLKDAVKMVLDAGYVIYKKVTESDL